MEGDVVCDIQTDKAVMAMEASEEGVMATDHHTVDVFEFHPQQL